MKSIFYFSVVMSNYNEEMTLRRSIYDLLKISFISQIIVIDDGSTDSSLEILKEYEGKITVLRNQKNMGKGYSIASGLELVKNEMVFLLDSDIINYTEADLKLLAEPVLSGEVDFTSKMTDDRTLYFLSGIRFYHMKDLLPLLGEMKKSTKYGLEVFLNNKLKNKKGKIVELKDYKHFQKFEKFKLPIAIWEYIKEGISIIGQYIRNLV